MSSSRTSERRTQCFGVSKSLEKWRATFSEKTQFEHDEIPWGRIISFRNRLIHGYFEIDFQRVWDVIQEEVGVLLQLIEGIVDLPPDDDGDEMPALR
jgi:hypothetical protein